MNDEVLEKFGNYVLLDRIGKGGMAGIFRARPAALDANGRIMVIKRLLPQIAANPEFLSMFRTETQICMAFNHPNLVQIHDFGSVGSTAYIAMEYVEGKNLKELVVAFAKENEHVPMEMAVDVIEQAARGLHYAHIFKNNATGEKLNLIHRDISPHNLLVSYDGNVKVIDFGIAKAEIDTCDVTRDGLIKGKVGYLSPEQVAGQRLDARSDIFALGIVLWELLTGRRLFIVPGQSDLQILQSIQQCDQYVAPPSSINPKVTEELDRIVMRALSQNPAMRFATAEEFAAALKKFHSAKFPEYGSGEMSSSLKKLFHNETEEDHRHLRELNKKAQQLLISAPKAPTSTDFSGPHTLTPPPFSTTTPLGSVAYMSAPSTPPVPQRRKLITRGRMIGAAFYVLTILLIKLDERYFFVERLMLPTDDVRIISQANRQLQPSAAAAARAKQQRAPAAAAQVQNPTPKAPTLVAPSAPQSETRMVPARGSQVLGKSLRNI